MIEQAQTNINKSKFTKKQLSRQDFYSEVINRANKSDIDIPIKIQEFENNVKT